MKQLIALTLLLTASAYAHAAPKLYVFDCGTLYMDDVSGFGLTNEETDVRELFVPCYLVENNGQWLLWDGGLPLDAAGKGRHVYAGLMDMDYRKSLLEQMQDMNLTPQDIDFAAFSHSHFDHVGAANAFTGSTLLIQQAEYDAAFKNHEQYEVFVYPMYSELEKAEKVLLDGEHDVFGDGSTLIVPAPGHTPGHQVLLIHLKNTGPIVLSGDLYHFEFNRTHRRVPVFNTDADETRRSMAAIEQLLKDTGARLWIEHNKALADTLMKAPAYYN